MDAQELGFFWKGGLDRIVESFTPSHEKKENPESSSPATPQKKLF
jgi:hypothetical protein